MTFFCIAQTYSCFETGRVCKNDVIGVDCDKSFFYLSGVQKGLQFEVT
jgi:hypothetical protein